MLQIQKKRGTDIMKRIVALLIAFTMAASLLPTYALETEDALDSYPTHNTDVLIEAESGCVRTTDLEIRNGKVASNYGAICLGGVKLDDPTNIITPDISYKINIPENGSYYVYARYMAPGGAADSLNVRWDGGNYIETSVSENGSDWGWTTLTYSAVYLSAGVHELDFLHREPGMIIDCFFVTTNYKEINTLAEELRIFLQPEKEPESPEFAVNSSAVTYDTNDGYLHVEAENIYFDTTAYRKITHQNSTISNTVVSQASGLDGLYAIVTHHEDMSLEETTSKTGMEFNFVADEPGVYHVWARVYIPGGGCDSVYVSLDGGNYGAGRNFLETLDEHGSSYEYQWREIASFSNIVEGTKHNVRLYPRESMNIIDSFVITNSTETPMGLDGKLVAMQLPDSKYPTPPHAPVQGQHPRLYFTEADIPAIKENMQKPDNAAALAAYEARLALEEDGDLSGSLLDDASNYDSSAIMTIESYAFKYAIDGDEEYGQKARAAVLKYLDTANFDKDAQDATRPIGHTVFFASEIYDWCYDLFTAEERKYIIEMCESIASMMEVGYPPSGQGAVVGHGSEAQIMRDLLGFGIAVYDERPDIYNYIGGRFFSEFIEPRNYWYPSATHWQGDAYGTYRYAWELVAQMMIYRMTGGDVNGGIKVFDDTQASLPYYWIYTRRPDGQVFRTGDCFIESGVGSENRSYWSSFYESMFMAGNFYGDSIVKGEYELENAIGYVSSPVFTLLFNDPDLAGNQDKSSLPLSRYFGSPNGMMIARTGWDLDSFDNANPSQSDDVVAMMKIGEMWSANHHHLDAGNFQIYYKGILASESGFYESYGTFHDRNYNKASVAHNVLTIYDPDENFGSYTGTDRDGNSTYFPKGVNDGGQRTPGGEPPTFSAWMSDNKYKTGVVLDHAIGPDDMEPEYTYIKGDIAQAYSSKVSKVMRSMVFMPLEDENYPAMMVVMDEVTSTNPSFKKKWLLHMQLEPEIDAENGVSIIKNNTNGYNGKLTVQTLLPKNAEITKIGGEGKRFWIGNQAGDFENDGYNFDTKSDLAYGGGGIEAGWGRIEVSPSEASSTDRFLNVLAVSDADNEALPLESELIEGENLVGVKTAGKVLMFSDVDTSNSLKNRVLSSASFTVPGDESTLDIMIAGVKSGTWKVMCGTKTKLVSADEDGGVLYFEGGAGEYEIEYYKEGSFSAEITDISASKDGNTYTVDVEFLGDNPGARVFVALYDQQKRIVDIRSAECTDEGICNLQFGEDSVNEATKVKLFMWSGMDKFSPLVKVTEMAPSELFE